MKQCTYKNFLVVNRPLTLQMFVSCYQPQLFLSFPLFWIQFLLLRLTHSYSRADKSSNFFLFQDHWISSIGQNVCPASDTKRNLRTSPSLWASKAIQSSVRLFNIDKSIAAKVEKENCEDYIGGRRRGGGRGRERKKRERKAEKRKRKEKTFKAFLRRKANKEFSYSEERLGD